MLDGEAGGGGAGVEAELTGVGLILGNYTRPAGRGQLEASGEAARPAPRRPEGTALRYEAR